MGSRRENKNTHCSPSRGSTKEKNVLWGGKMAEGTITRYLLQSFAMQLAAQGREAEAGDHKEGSLADSLINKAPSLFGIAFSSREPNSKSIGPGSSTLYILTQSSFCPRAKTICDERDDMYTCVVQTT